MKSKDVVATTSTAPTGAPSSSLSNGMGGSSASSTGAAANGNVVPLQTLLKEADLLEYYDKMKSVLKLRHAGDLAYTEEKDLSSIGMSRPEQKRLRQEYAKLVPQSSIVVKLRRAVFGKSESRPSEYINAGASGEEEPQQHLIPASHIQLCKELGVGEFGHVYLSSWTQGNGDVIQVAVKRVLPDKLFTDASSFLHEAAIMARMRHENVVRLFGVVLDTRSVMLVSELAPCGSLLECLQKPALRHSFPVDVLCLFAVQIARGMQFLASEKLLHRDLAARNVLVFSAEKVKISDFGLSRSLGVGEDYYKSEFSPGMKLPIAWCAPECINFLRFTEKSDVFAFGVTLWEMFGYGREMPWSGFTGAEILAAIDQHGQRLERPEACPVEIYGVMQQCWAHAPDERPNFEQLASCLPDLSPQLLVTVTEHTSGDQGRLQFRRNDTIILINRCPAGSVNSDLWMGALRSGAVGLFRPADTVAYLGAESPAPSGVLASLKSTPAPKKKDLKSGKVPPEKKKLLISEPQGDVRHTCHVGIDGSSFGLLQCDKNDLSKALPPPFPVSAGEARVPPRPAPRRLGSAAPVSPGTPVRHISSEKNVLETRDTAPPPLFPRHRTLSPPPPPALPPKPTRASTALVIENRLHSTNVSPNGTANRNTVAGNLMADLQHRREQLLNLERQEDSGDTGGSSGHSSHPETELDRVLCELQQDITNFSVSTQRTESTVDSLDFSDTRPLLQSRTGARPDTDGVLSYMDESEFEAMQRKATQQHQKVQRDLEKARSLDRKASRHAANPPTRPPPASASTDDLGQFSARTEQRRREVLAPEAEEAYKLLVQCGHRLKSASPLPEPRPPSRTSTTSSTATELTVIAGTQYVRASAPPASDLSPATTLDRVPPCVPPKPKLRQPIEARRVDDYVNQRPTVFASPQQEVVKL